MEFFNFLKSESSASHREYAYFAVIVDSDNISDIGSTTHFESNECYKIGDIVDAYANDAKSKVRILASTQNKYITKYITVPRGENVWDKLPKITLKHIKTVKGKDVFEGVDNEGTKYQIAMLGKIAKDKDIIVRIHVLILH